MCTVLTYFGNVFWNQTCIFFRLRILAPLEPEPSHSNSSAVPPFPLQYFFHAYCPSPLSPSPQCYRVLQAQHSLSTYEIPYNVFFTLSSLYYKSVFDKISNMGQLYRSVRYLALGTVVVGELEVTDSSKLVQETRCFSILCRVLVSWHTQEESVTLNLPSAS